MIKLFNKFTSFIKRNFNNEKELVTESLETGDVASEVQGANIKKENSFDMDSMLECYFSSEMKIIKESSFFLHGGFENLNYSPLKRQPMWLAYFSSESEVEDFSYGKDNSRRYVTKFHNKDEIKLLIFKEVNTVPIASKLKPFSSLPLDRALASYVKSKGAQGLIGPTGHVMLNEPANIVYPTDFNVSQNKFFLMLISQVENGKISYIKRRVHKNDMLKSNNITYKALLSFDVLEFDKEELNQIEFSVLSLDDAIYHLARYIDSKPAVINNSLMGSSWYEKMQYIKESTSHAS